MVSAGFTLVELLVAVAVMAMLAVMSWRGLDGMGRAQTRIQAHSEEVLALQAGLAQWGADLNELTQMPPVGGLDFDGRVLRIIRHYAHDDIPAGLSGAAAGGGAGSMRVIAWGARELDGRRQWLRWQSAPLRQRTELVTAWQQAALWGQNPTEELMRREVAIAAVDDWQVFYFRKDSWTSPLSSAAGAVGANTGGQTLLPDGVRLVLTLADGQALSGKLTRDWVRPTVGPGAP